MTPERERHRELNYKIHRGMDEIARLAKRVSCDVGDDPGLDVAILHVRSLLVTANHRQFMRACPEEGMERYWEGCGPHYLTRGEMGQEVQTRLCGKCGCLQQVDREFCMECHNRVPG